MGWHPTSESRHFTREDAAKVFDEKLLPANARVPHPELAILHKEQIERLSPQERQERAAARDAIAEKKRAAKAARQAKKEAAIKKVDTGRWEFHFTDVNVDAAGKTGRGHKGLDGDMGNLTMTGPEGRSRYPPVLNDHCTMYYMCRRSLMVLAMGILASPGWMYCM